VRVTVLGSGSRGNALVVEFGATRIAVDAGFGPRGLARRLRESGIEPESVQAAVITHEHQDHAQGAFHARSKWRWTLISHEATFAKLGAGAAVARLVMPAFGTATEVDGVLVTLYPIPHDAAAPAAVVLEHIASGRRVGVAHDLGAVPAALVAPFRDLDIAVIEANHDVDMLRQGPYPPSLQRRVSGGAGHLSNVQAGAWVREIASARLQHVVLAHLSETNNTPELAVSAVRGALKGSPYRGSVQAAGQRVPCAVGEPAQTQLGLW
jgi:phosphoribosyl 1,2-cyclic phosphodiesterase